MEITNTRLQELKAILTTEEFNTLTSSLAIQTVGETNQSFYRQSTIYTTEVGFSTKEDLDKFLDSIID